MKTLKIESPFNGEYTETVALGNLLKQVDINLSEAMLFGLGQGLDYSLLEAKGKFPIIGGTINLLDITKNTCRSLGLKFRVIKNQSRKDAEKTILDCIDENKLVMIQVNTYYLDYFDEHVENNAYFVVAYGYDEKFIYLIDTKKQSYLNKVSRIELQLSRDQSGLFCDKNLSLTIESKKSDFNKRKILKEAIITNASSYLHPKNENYGFKGIIKSAYELEGWYEMLTNKKSSLKKAGLNLKYNTPRGSLFRGLYIEFLEEANLILNDDKIREALDLLNKSRKKIEKLSDKLINFNIENSSKELKSLKKLFFEIGSYEVRAFIALSNLD